MVDPCGQRTTHADGARASTILASSRGAAEQARDDDRVEEILSLAEEAEEEKWRKKGERTTRQCSENTLHIVLHLPSNATPTAAATAATAAAAAATRTPQ